MNLFRHGLADPGDPLQLAEAGAGDGSRRAEMVQQRALAPRADADDLVERRTPQRLSSLGAVRSDCEAVRLVPQALQKVEHGVPWVEREWRSPGQKKPLAPGVAVWTFSYCSNGNIINA